MFILVTIRMCIIGRCNQMVKNVSTFYSVSVCIPVYAICTIDCYLLHPLLITILLWFNCSTPFRFSYSRSNFFFIDFYYHSFLHCFQFFAAAVVVFFLVRATMLASQHIRNTKNVSKFKTKITCTTLIPFIPVYIVNILEHC